MLALGLPLLPGVCLHPGTISSTSRLLGAGLAAAAHSSGAGAVSPLRSNHGRWSRGFAVYAPGTETPAESQADKHPQHQLHAHEKPHLPTTTTATSLKPSASFAASAVSPHRGLQTGTPHFMESHMPHPAYTEEYLEAVHPTHVKPEKLHQVVGYRAIRLVRWLFDRATGYRPVMSDAAWLRRIVFLETVAGVPGMVAGMLRHLKSLRTMQRDHGWIHTLLEEAENERMHLITFLELRRPGPLFRAAVIAAQGAFFNAYFLAYLVSPRTCHAFVGFLEEEAVKTYSHALAEIDAGRLWKDAAAPPVAVAYWGLRPDATMRDLILAVRADEACHAHVNHTFSQLAQDQTNPFAAGASQLP